MFRRLAISGIGSLEKVTSAVGIAGREQAANNECVRKRGLPRLDAAATCQRNGGIYGCRASARRNGVSLGETAVIS